MKKIVINILSALLCANVLLINAAEPVIEKKEVIPGMHSYLMYTSTDTPESKKIEIIGTISVSYGDILAQLISPLVDNLDLSAAPATFLELRTVLKIIKNQYGANFNDMAMIGDLYINPAYRGKGLATKLMQHVCQKLRSEGISFIALIPDPFEYVDGTQQSLRGLPEYAEKRQQLIRLYQQLGFTVADETEPVLMYWRR